MRCAIYTRVSTDEQARSDYSSLDRQRELCASYVDLHGEDDWKVTEVYEDGGYSGKDMNRPALQRLLRDFTNGKVDAVVTYKIDRVSRSLKDFYDFWELLQEHKVTFASATQQFDTSTSAGMLMLNILLSFAQYERELTRERTLSKMAGRAERGLWNGGMVPIGFDYCAEGKALTANEREAEIVQFAFERFIETKSPSLVANEANSRGYRTKKRQVVARDGATKEIGGNRFDEDTVNELRTRAKDALLTMEIAREERVEEVSQDLRDLEFEGKGLTPELIAKLAAGGIHTRDDLADLAVDELTELTAVDEAQAKALIMKAREHWFTA